MHKFNKNTILAQLFLIASNEMKKNIYTKHICIYVLYIYIYYIHTQKHTHVYF